MKRTIIISLLLLTAVISSTGCSVLFNTSASRPENGELTESPIELANPILEQKEAGTEVTWEVPSETVDGFVIRYGSDRTNLSKEVTIFRSELREERDSKFGPVYRYILREIPDSGAIFVAVAAFKGDVISDFSEVVAEKVAQ